MLVAFYQLVNLLIDDKTSLLNVFIAFSSKYALYILICNKVYVNLLLNIITSFTISNSTMQYLFEFFISRLRFSTVHTQFHYSERKKAPKENLESLNFTE